MACAKAREVSDEDLKSCDGKLINAKEYGTMVAEADRVVAF